jgi:DNA-binding MarR family transcriptional regulator
MNNRQGDNTAGKTAAREQLLGLLQVAKGLEERIEKALAEVQLSVAKYGVLTHLVDAGEAIPLSELATRGNCVRSNVTQMIDRLEAEGLVMRVPSPSDRRIILAELTVEGRQRQEAGALRMKALEALLEVRIPADDRPAIRRAMEALS